MASLAAAPIAPALVTGGHSFVEHASSAAPSQDDAMQAKLQIGRRAQKSLRCKVAGATALICILLFAAMMLTVVALAPERGGAGAAVQAIAAWLAHLGIAVFLLGMLPDDGRMTRVVPGVTTFFLFGMMALFFSTAPAYAVDAAEGHCDAEDHRSGAYCAALATIYFSFAFTTTAGFAGFLFTVTRREVRRRYELYWLHFKWIMAAFAVLQTSNGVASAAVGDPLGAASYVAIGAANAALSLVAASSTVRARAHGALVRLVDARGAAAAAAGIAALLGDADPDAVLREAKQRLRGVRFSKLSAEMVMARTPDPALYALAEPAAPGGVDAFLSHSWSDDPVQKWQMIKAWCDEFEARHGREPLLWLDKVRACGASPLVAAAVRAPSHCASRVPGVYRPAQHRREPALPAGLPELVRQASRAERPHLHWPPVVRHGALHIRAHGRQQGLRGDPGAAGCVCHQRRL